VIRASRAEVSPVIDGRLDDACWSDCRPVSEFHMIEPTPGAPVTQPTEVRICFDDENLYVGVHMSEAKPDAMQAAVNQHDGDIFMDDSFEIMLDTYCDRRNAYVFLTNLLGAKLEGRIIDECRNFDENWDCHWTTKSQLVPGGWEMEFAIPFSELNYPMSDSIIWGVNFWRIERPHWENTSWAPVDVWCQVSRYGTLKGLEIRTKAKRFELLPYVAGWYNTDSLDPRAGLDLEFDMTSDLILNATFLPDFAQIEADPLRFNLSYQQGEELYFPEKRPFFLEGGGILDTPFDLFYTRRMNEILAGGKLYGKIKSTELLLLDVQTDDTDENFSVLRLKQEIFGSSTIGALLTHKQREDTMSQAAGLDLNFPVCGPFLFTSQFAVSKNTGITGDPFAMNLGIGGETATYGAGIYLERVGPEFHVEQGFIRTYEIDRQEVGGYGWKHWIEDWGAFQYIDGGASFDLSQEIGDRLAFGNLESWLNFVFRNKFRLGMWGFRRYERYGEAEFTNSRLDFQLETNVGGAEGVASTFGIGRLYDEAFKFFHFGFLVLPMERISVFPYFQAIKLGDTRWQWLLNARISYQVADRAFVRVFLQGDSEYGTVSEKAMAVEDILNVSANVLFGYEFGPGTILYFVYNHARDFETETTDHIFVAKFTYSIRF
jgi:hypothetical protein